MPGWIRARSSCCCLGVSVSWAGFSRRTSCSAAGSVSVNTAASEIVVAVRRIVALQAGAAALVAAGFFIGKGQWAAESGLYGGLISVVNALLLSRGVIRAAAAAQLGYVIGMRAGPRTE